MNKEIIQKTAQFHELVLSKIDELKAETQSLQKTAQYYQEDKVYLIQKLANLLYESDFFTDSASVRAFIKSAESDSDVILNMIQKVCKAAEVSSLGKPADITISNKNSSDPVYVKTFGSSNYLY